MLKAICAVTSAIISAAISIGTVQKHWAGGISEGRHRDHASVLNFMAMSKDTFERSGVQ